MSGHLVSPFLHRDERQAPRYAPSAHRMRAEHDRIQAKLTLERLRYRWWQRQGTLGSFMQRFGDWGREYAGFLNPTQTGGGWW